MERTEAVPRIAIKRIYVPSSERDGYRVLVDRVWPRGVSRKNAAIDHWAKDIAPSTALRKWFGHDPAKWTEFRKRYRKEIEGRISDLRRLLEECGRRRMTLLFAAKDTKHNQAVVLKNALEGMRPGRGTKGIRSPGRRNQMSTRSSRTGLRRFMLKRPS
ncbi:MAG: DUF488 domain-containing protein [Rhodospirillales bacterium]|nr:DUF488 domain-containing protein [Rhodospirillales bacterium]